jgi:hypothetical protein
VNTGKLALAPEKLFVGGLRQIAVSWTPYGCLIIQAMEDFEKGKRQIFHRRGEHINTDTGKW